MPVVYFAAPSQGKANFLALCTVHCAMSELYTILYTIYTYNFAALVSRFVWSLLYLGAYVELEYV